MKFFIECGTSGVGFPYEGTLEGAIEQAKGYRRFKAGYNKIYNEDNDMVAQVRYSDIQGCTIWMPIHSVGTWY